MFSTALLAIAGAAVAGLVLKWFLDFQRVDQEITWLEYGIGVVVIGILVTPLTLWVGKKIAIANNLTFYEYWNGWEIRARRGDITCSRDGPCYHEYDCDPYPVLVSYSCNCTKDGCDTCWRTEIHYHSCPYVKVETTYEVATTLGDYTIASHRFPDNPQAHRWRESTSIPDQVIQLAGVGIPRFWEEARLRAESGHPGPVTQRRKYQNYILASDQTILRQYSGSVEDFLKAGLLPRLQTEVRDFYYSDKVYFVGFQPQNAGEWQKAISYFNAAFGSELQGDLHLVLAKDPRVQANPDGYLLALKAYWQNPQFFEKNALSKNAVVVLIGTEDEKTVAWARAITGMPLGNEKLTVEIYNRLKSSALNPETIIGRLEKKRTGSEKGHLANYDFSGFGILESACWGLNNFSTRFKRVAMTPDDTGGSGAGFTYLASDIKMSKSQKFWTGFCAFVFSIVVWIAAAFIGERGGWRQYWR